MELIRHYERPIKIGMCILYVVILTGAGALGIRGLSVTMPLKESVALLVDRRTPLADRLHAVNCVTFGGDGTTGDNTDGPGLVRDLTERHGLDLRERRVLLLGAGGAARGVAPALLDAGIHSLYVVNRNSARADALADAMGEPGRVHARGWDALQALGEFDLLVNATSAARGGALPPLPMGLASLRSAAVDLSYGEAAVAFLAWARAAGCTHALDGLGMLVEQAAESFLLWHGLRPETDGVYAALNGQADALVTAD